ncbi:MAG: helix-turn-helix domain-containing protein [Butyrivibrio sp.]
MKKSEVDMDAATSRKKSPELVAMQKELRDSVMGQLVAIRKEKNMTQNDISVLTGILRPNISRMESGNYNPTLDMLVRVADSLGLKVNITFEEK